MELNNHFKMKDLGESRVILGMNISRNRAGKILSISQERCVSKVIERYGMQSANGKSTPMDPSVDLSGTSDHCSEPYREAIGSLMYLTVATRPDIAFSVCNLANFVENPTNPALGRRQKSAQICHSNFRIRSTLWRTEYVSNTMCICRC